ncbi:MAG: HEAT repeat domain-containing protein [Candidatus Pristimantibacillus sp.]
MSVAIINELHQEVRRLFIAGSRLAANDPRLVKLHPQLAQLGENSPVFKRLADHVQKVLDSEGEALAPSLLELGGLLHAILYTQGNSDANKSSIQIEPLGCANSIPTPYRKLQPLLEALTVKGSGRLSVIVAGYEQGLFKDFRAYLPTLHGLNDVPEIADFLADKVIPDIGIVLLPLLLRDLNLQGGKGDARKLRAIQALQGDADIQLYERAVQEGSTEVRKTAIGLLGKYDGSLPLLLEQSRDSKSEIRRAAYYALSDNIANESIDRLYEAFIGKDQSLTIEPIQLSNSEHLSKRVTTYISEQLSVVDELSTSNHNTDQDSSQVNKSKQDKWLQTATENISAGIQSLTGKRNEAVSEVLQQALNHDSFMSLQQPQLHELIAQLLLEQLTEESDLFLIGLQSRWDNRFNGYSLQAAVRHLSAGEIYERFSPDLRKKSSAASKALIWIMAKLLPSIESAIWRSSDEPEYAIAGPTRSLPQAFRDERWIPFLREFNYDFLLVRFFQEYEPDELTISYLKDRLIRDNKVQNSEIQRDVRTITVALIATTDSFTPQYLLNAIQFLAAQSYYSMNYNFIDLVALLPESYASHLEAFKESQRPYVKELLEGPIEQIKQNHYAEIPAIKGAERIAWLNSKLN